VSRCGLCRTDSDGKTWTNAACRVHGVDSAVDEPDREVADLSAAIAHLKGTNW
jgi:hypothetical protein